MQVFCKATNGDAELHCYVCGQGFVLFWERSSPAQRLAALPGIQETLRLHHLAAQGPQAHPQDRFLVPDWSGSIAPVETARPGGPPAWDL